MPTITAKVVADSLAPSGVRLTTLELQYPRYIHSELMTHRVFSRCSASSRAIPIDRMIEQASVVPAHWGKNQPGMQAAEELQGESRAQAVEVWREAMLAAKKAAKKLSDIGVHKQTANRLLEPFMYMHTLVSATEWKNFFNLRISPLAQPEMCQLAIAMRDAMAASKPVQLGVGQWHTPYIGEQEEPELECCIKRSVARCARVSRNLHGKTQVSDRESDLELFKKLAGANPMHASPLEHVATPSWDSRDVASFVRNFRDWVQYRSFLEPWECERRTLFFAQGAPSVRGCPIEQDRTQPQPPADAQLGEEGGQGDSKEEGDRPLIRRTVKVLKFDFSPKENLQVRCEDLTTGERFSFWTFFDNQYCSSSGDFNFKKLRDRGGAGTKLSCLFRRSDKGFLRCISAKHASAHTTQETSAQPPP
ncbi:MAG: FAD-dependent thymidylate synthase [Actinomycetaceae bacterium]|nr:FAD-dependent thymidylate synthase [Actinomycetaceae bacterium]